MAPSRRRARGIDTPKYSSRHECPRRASVGLRVALDVEELDDDNSLIAGEDLAKDHDHTED
jgi:hypothetical protein